MAIDDNRITCFKRILEIFYVGLCGSHCSPSLLLDRSYLAMALSPQQLSSLLEELRTQDVAGSGWVPAGCVETALRRAGIVSSAQQDEALLLLIVNAESGQVGYSRLRDEIELANRKTPSEPIATISQQDLVFKVMTELRELYNSFDLGGISVQGLRNGIARLGLKETQALKELLRHSYEMTFHQLVAALTKVDVRETQVSALSKSSLNRSRNIFDEERAMEQKARKPIARTAETERTSMMPHRHPDPENRNDNMLFGDRSDMTSASSFATTSQVSSSPVRGRIAPITSAGYDTRDKGLLRQQVHAAIRRLDAAEFDERMFSRRLSDLGIAPLPEAAQKLLDRQLNGNRISFKEWVRAFEPYFEEKTFQEEQRDSSSRPKMPEPAQDPKTLRGSQFRPRQGGGIFGFEDPAAHDRESMKARGPINRPQRSTLSSLVPELMEDGTADSDSSKTRKAAMRAQSASSRPDFLCWTEQDHQQPPQQPQKPMRGLVGAHVNDFKPPPFAREGDPIVSKSVTGIDRTASARRQHGRTPFGTEADYASGFANGALPPTFG